jgi:hypothetical protein
LYVKIYLSITAARILCVLNSRHPDLRHPDQPRSKSTAR